MSSDETSIHVEGLSKRYEVYARPVDRLKQMILPRVRRWAHQPERAYFEEFWALHNVGFDVCKGQTVGIVGRNGSGKSTLLQLICGTLTPTEGAVDVHGRVAALLELGSGFNPEFSGRENAYLNASVLGLSRHEIDARFDDIVAFADIGDFIDRPVKTYSTGMQLRLGFAVQAVVDPDILIVDEALAVGDEKFQRKCFSRLEDLKAQGTSILFVSHAMQQVVELCDAAMLLEHGERLIYGPPAMIARAYQKLLYSPAQQQNQLIEDLRGFDKSGTAGAGTVDRFVKLIQNIGSNPNACADGVVPDGKSGQGGHASYDADLVPDTTSVYPKQGAQIASIRILDEMGSVVNVLQCKREYRFVVTGKFLSDAEGVHFGVHIRTISGVEVTGQRFPENGKYVESVRSGQAFEVIFAFNMVLLPGTYFSGGGVWSVHEPSCMHRIVDALMFRVVPEEKEVSFGYLDASTRDPLAMIA